MFYLVGFHKGDFRREGERGREGPAALVSGEATVVVIRQNYKARRLWRGEVEEVGNCGAGAEEVEVGGRVEVSVDVEDWM